MIKKLLRYYLLTNYRLFTDIFRWEKDPIMQSVVVLGVTLAAILTGIALYLKIPISRGYNCLLGVIIFMSTFPLYIWFDLNPPRHEELISSKDKWTGFVLFWISLFSIVYIKKLH